MSHVACHLSADTIYTSGRIPPGRCNPASPIGFAR